MIRGSDAPVVTRDDIISAAKEKLRVYFANDELFDPVRSTYGLAQERCVAHYYIYVKLKENGFGLRINSLARVLGQRTAVDNIRRVDQIMRGNDRDFSSRGIRFCVTELLQC